MKTIEELGISPAPWTVIRNADVASGGCLIRTPGLASSVMERANARLIAAAPELYEALRECEQKLDAIDPYCNLLSDVREVLSKAGGAE